MKQIDNRQKEVQQLKAGKGHLLSFRDKSHLKTRQDAEHHIEQTAKKKEVPKEDVKLQDISHAKAGRNDPCPCGSGKKYKKCCLNKT